MLKLENTEVVGWEAAIRGMRNPMNSWRVGYEMGVRRYQNKDGTLSDPYCAKKTHPIMETINILRRIFIMCKKEEAGKKILNVMIIIEDIYDENIPIDKFNKEDLLKLHKTLMELQKGIMYSKEIES